MSLYRRLKRDHMRLYKITTNYRSTFDLIDKDNAMLYQSSRFHKLLYIKPF